MARGGPTARRYAQALFQLATEHGKEEAWMDALRQAQEHLAEPTVALYLGVPRVPTARKLEAVAQVMGGEEPLLANAVSLLVLRRSLDIVPDVVREYAALLNESQGKAQARVTSAAEMSSAQQERLRGLLHEMLNKDVVLDLTVDPDIIGGMVVQVGDQIVDGSVRNRLQALKRRLQREQVAG